MIYFCRYLSEVLTENTRISKSHVRNAFEAVYNNNEFGLDIFLTFLSKNVNVIDKKYGKNLRLVNLVTKLGNNIFGKQQLLKVGWPFYIGCIF